MHGKAEVQKHYQQLIDAGAANFVFKITQVELKGNDTGVTAGDYTVVANGKTIIGHWFEILRQEAGTESISNQGLEEPRSCPSDRLAPELNRCREATAKRR